MSPKLWFLNYPKNCMIPAGNVSLLKQFIYMHLKVLINIIQQMTWFIRVRATVHEILAIKTSKRCWLSRKLTNFSDSNLNISETVGHRIINNTISLKCITRPFRCIYVSCLLNLDFLMNSAQNCKKYTILDNLRTITQ